MGGGHFRRSPVTWDWFVILPTFRRALAPICLVVVLGGCSITFDTASLGVPVRLSEPAGAPVEGSSFSITKKAVYLFFGVLPASRPSLEGALAGQLVDGNEVADLRIKVRSRFADLLITALTAGLVVPRSVTYEGVIVDQDR